MTSRFVGIDPNTAGEGSPTVWVEEESANLILQGEEADERRKTEAGSTQWPRMEVEGLRAVWRRYQGAWAPSSTSTASTASATSTAPWSL